MNNKRRLFSTVLCVAALTAGLFVSGCGSDKAGGIGSVVSSVVDGGDEKSCLQSLTHLSMQLTASTVTMHHLLNSKQKVWLN